mgnify:CR=1 FL=1
MFNEMMGKNHTAIFKGLLQMGNFNLLNFDKIFHCFFTFVPIFTIFSFKEKENTSPFAM